MIIYSSNFLICNDGQNDVTTHIYVSKTMLLAFSFRGMPLIQGVCPRCDQPINKRCSLGPSEALLKKLDPKIIDRQKFVTES